ncbi:hypothetical protein OHV05_04435 [Kitasatospora sp. NBC_00070]|uniref:hypothetical protein n=1 Tax=Kitasatospora sp. NBC_00070 TaxID=2975962 RepID=UPI00324A22DE
MPLEITTETTGRLTVRSGGTARVWHTDRGTGTVSLAVPGDRIVLTPAEARALARAISTFADAVETAHQAAGLGRATPWR